MSWHLVSLVYQKQAGSAIRKSILSYCADKASDDGTGVWASKATIAAELECGRSTVIRVINEFVAEGLLIESGTRKCTNGATVNYTVCEDKIRALPDVKKPVPERDQSQSGTSVTVDQSQSGTPPVPERDPMGSQSGTQTSLEPPLNGYTPHNPPKEKNLRKARIPQDWVLSDEGWEYARSLQLQDNEIQEIADDFRTYWTEGDGAGKRRTERGWHQAWQGRCRNVVSEYIRNRRILSPSQPRGYGQGGSVADVVARRRMHG